MIEADGHRVVASAKSITTKGDLSIGVTGAITAAVAKLPEGLRPEDISLVSVSTTLATNAVVEGHGSAVGVILIGFDQAMAERTGIAKAFPGMPIAMIAGGPRPQWRGGEAAGRGSARGGDCGDAGRCVRHCVGLRGAEPGA